jgi:uncharacterized membrane protein
MNYYRLSSSQVKSFFETGLILGLYFGLVVFMFARDGISFMPIFVCFFSVILSLAFYKEHKQTLKENFLERRSVFD